MTNQLRDRLDDLLEGVPDHVVADPHMAWQAGARRRTRRKLVVVAAVAVVLAVAGGAMTLGPKLTGPQPADEPPSRATSYPTRVESPLRDRPHDDSHEALAGVFSRDGEGWSAVTTAGRVYRIDGAADVSYLPSISPDGLRLAFLTTNYGQSDFGVTDVATGAGYSGSAGGPGVNNSWLVGPGEQSFWSPDSARLVVPVTRDPAQVRGRRQVVAIYAFVGGPDPGGVVRAPQDGKRGQLVGWASADNLGWLRWDDQAPVLAVTTPRPGTVLETRALEPPAEPAGPAGVVFASLSPFGDGRLAVMTTTALLVYDAAGGLESETPLPHTRAGRCPVSWSEAGPVVPVTDSGDDAILVSPDAKPLVQADPALDVGCSMWAPDALSGNPDKGLGARLFGTSTSWVSWNWWRLTLATLVVAAAIGAGVIVRRRLRF